MQKEDLDKFSEAIDQLQELADQGKYLDKDAEPLKECIYNTIKEIEVLAGWDK